MSKTRTHDGSYAIAIGAAIGGAICLALTGFILHTFGKSIGTTLEGKALLSWAAVAVHILGFVLMGLALGYFLNKHTRSWSWAVPCFLVMLSAGGFTFTNLYGFASGERMSATKAAEDARQRIVDAATDRKELARQRQAAQERLAKSQLGFMQAEVEDARGRSRRQLSKDFAKNSAQIIAEIGKENQVAPTARVDAELSPDEGAAQLAEITGLTTRAVQVGYAMWLAKLLVALEMLLWPMASFTWPRRISVALEQAPERAPPVEAEAVAVLAEPVAPIPAKPTLMLEHKTERPPVQAPERASWQLMPGAEASLAAIGMPAHTSGPLRPKIRDKKELAAKFVTWLQAGALHGEKRHSDDDIQRLLAEFCRAYHCEQPIDADIRTGLGLLPNRLAYKSRPADNPGRPVRWSIAPGKYPKPAARKEPEPASSPKQEGGIVHWLRPLGGPGNDPEPAPHVDPIDTFSRRVDKNAFRRHDGFDDPVLNAARAHWMRRDARHSHRKQRGSRVGKRAA